MAKFKPYKLLSSKLSSLPIIEGQLVLATDTKKLYFDINSTTRVLVNSDAIINFSVSGKTVTYTRADGTTGTFNTQDTNTTYSVVTTEKDGLMSKDMLTKLNGIAAGAQVNTVTGVKGSSETNYRTGNINITKNNIGLNNVENKSSATIRGEITATNVTTALGYTPLNITSKGAANGVAELGADGKVPSTQLPSYVDDVLEYAKLSSFPTTGETGKIYVAQDTNKTYRWSGTAYIEISSSIALGETSSTAYRGDRGKTAYDHAVAKGSAFSNGLYKITTNAQGHVTEAAAVTKSDITALGVPAADTTYEDATTEKAGLMSTEDKTFINALKSGQCYYGEITDGYGSNPWKLTINAPNTITELKKGILVIARMSGGFNTDVNLKLNNFDAYPVYFRGKTLNNSSSNGLDLKQGDYIGLIFDNTYSNAAGWHIIYCPKQILNPYNIGFASGESSTTESTAIKVVELDQTWVTYGTPNLGSVIAVRFSNDFGKTNTPQLKIGSNTYNVRYRGQVTWDNNNYLPAGTTGIFMYGNSWFNLIGTDILSSGGSGSNTVVSSTQPSDLSEGGIWFIEEE